MGGGGGSKQRVGQKKKRSSVGEAVVSVGSVDKQSSAEMARFKGTVHTTQHYYSSLL